MFNSSFVCQVLTKCLLYARTGYVLKMKQEKRQMSVQKELTCIKEEINNETNGKIND